MAGLKRWFLDAFEPGRGKLPLGLLTLAAVLALTGIVLLAVGAVGRPQSDSDKAFVTSIAPDGNETLVAFPLEALDSRPGEGKLLVTGDEGQQITVATAKRSDFDAWKTAASVLELTGFNTDDSTKFTVNETSPTAGVTLGDLRDADLWTGTKFKTTQVKLTAKEINSMNATGPLVVVVFAESAQSVKEVSMQWPNPNADKASNAQMWGGGLITLLGLALLGYVAWDRHHSTVPALQRRDRRGSRSPDLSASGGGTILPGAETTPEDQDRHRHSGQIPGSNVSLTDAVTASSETDGPDGAQLASGINRNATGAEPGTFQSAVSHPGTERPSSDWLESNTVHHIPDEVRQTTSAQAQPGAQTGQTAPEEHPNHPQTVGHSETLHARPTPAEPGSAEHASDKGHDSQLAPRRDPGPRPQPSVQTQQWSTNLQPGGDVSQDEYQLPPISAQELLDGRTGALDQIDPNTGRPIDPNQQLPRPARNTKDDPHS